jgi:DNA repair exonuclease SbcCD nuclease subunit
MIKYLIIGDTHLDTKYPGYLENQVEALKYNIKKHRPNNIIFLGDISDKRKPSPEVLLKIKELFDFLDIPTYVLMGNHDASNKSDDGLTYLSLFNSDFITVCNNATSINILGKIAHLIPHYENESQILTYLNSVKASSDDIIFGHFGYRGCINSIGDYDFSIDPADIHCRTFLGHIHRSATYNNIEILGTPYPTSFFEADHKGFLGLLKVYSNTKIVFEKVPFVGGPRYINCKLEDIDTLAKKIDSDKYYNVVRVLLNPSDKVYIPDLIKKLIEEYKVNYVDVKYVNPDLELVANQNPYLISPGEFNDASFEEYLNKLEFPYKKEEVLNVLNKVKTLNDTK